MKRIVILGSSAASASIIQQAKKVDPECSLTLIGFDGYLPYQRSVFDRFIGKDIEPAKVFCRSKEFYDQHQVNAILDRKIARINTKRQIVFMEDKEQIAYDVLIVSDTPENKFPEVKGKSKSEVYGTKKLKDVDRLAGVVPLIDTVVVQSDSFTGLQIASAVARRGKEAIVVTSGNGFLSRYFDRDVAQWLISELEQAKLRIIPDAAIEEILGDKDAKAVRLNSGKVYSTQAVVFVEYPEDLKLFTDAGLRMADHVDVDEHCQTSIENIYAIDLVSREVNADFPATPNELEQQAVKVIASIFAGEADVQPAIKSFRFQAGDIIVDVIGDISKDAYDDVQWRFDQESRQYRALYVRENRLIGAITVNRADEDDQLRQLIREGGSIEPLLAQNEPSGQGSSQTDISTELVDN